MLRHDERDHISGALGGAPRVTLAFARALEIHEEVLRSVRAAGEEKEGKLGRRRTSRTRDAVQDLPSVNRSMLTLNESVFGPFSSHT